MAVNQRSIIFRSYDEIRFFNFDDIPSGDSNFFKFVTKPNGIRFLTANDELFAFMCNKNNYYEVQVFDFYGNLILSERIFWSGVFMKSLILDNKEFFICESGNAKWYDLSNYYELLHAFRTKLEFADSYVLSLICEADRTQKKILLDEYHKEQLKKLCTRISAKKSLQIALYAELLRMSGNRDSSCSLV